MTNKNSIINYLGHDKLASRIYGGIALTLGGIFAYQATGLRENSPSIATVLMYSTAGIFIIEGLGDLISGEHHYLSERFLKKFRKNKNLEEISK